MTILRAYSSLIPQAMEMLRNAPEVFINKEFTGFQMDLYLVPQRFESVLVPCLNHDKFDHVTEINFTFPRENNCRVWNYWLSADTLKISHCSKHRALPGGNRTSLSVTQNNISSHSLSKKMIIEILTSRWWSHKWQKLLVRHNKDVLVTKFYDKVSMPRVVCWYGYGQSVKKLGLNVCKLQILARFDLVYTFD